MVLVETLGLYMTLAGRRMAGYAEPGARKTPTCGGERKIDDWHIHEQRRRIGEIKRRIFVANARYQRWYEAHANPKRHPTIDAFSEHVQDIPSWRFFQCVIRKNDWIISFRLAMQLHCTSVAERSVTDVHTRFKSAWHPAYGRLPNFRANVWTRSKKEKEIHVRILFEWNYHSHDSVWCFWLVAYSRKKKGWRWMFYLVWVDVIMASGYRGISHNFEIPFRMASKAWEKRMWHVDNKGSYCRMLAFSLG